MQQPRAPPPDRTSAFSFFSPLVGADGGLNQGANLNYASSADRSPAAVNVSALSESYGQSRHNRRTSAQRPRQHVGEQRGHPTHGSAVSFFYAKCGVARVRRLGHAGPTTRLCSRHPHTVRRTMSGSERQRGRRRSVGRRGGTALQ